MDEAAAALRQMADLARTAREATLKGWLLSRYAAPAPAAPAPAAPRRIKLAPQRQRDLDQAVAIAQHHQIGQKRENAQIGATPLHCEDRLLQRRLLAVRRHGFACDNLVLANA